MPGIDKDALEKAAEKVFKRSNYFSDYVLETIARRIKSVGQLSAYDQQTLKNMADISGDMKAITKKLAEITGQNINDIEKIYTKTVSDGVNSYKPMYDFKGMQFKAFEENEFAQQLASHWFKETAGEMINLSRTKAIGFDKYNLTGEVIGHAPLEGAFQKAVDDAVAALSDGTVDFNTAMRETIKNLGGSGVKVTYGSGVNRSLSSMVRQNLLYGAKQSAIAYDEHVSSELGCDGFEVDAHAGCRPSHEFMQGQMYSYDGDRRIGGVVYKDGSEALKRLSDYGCLHFKTGVILGVSEPRYNKKELKRIHKETTELIEFDGRQKTLYEWKQTQRKFEREVRKESRIRDMAKSAGNKTLAKDCEDKINTFRKKYDDMCAKTGLEPRYERMRTYFGRTFEKSSEKGISKKLKFTTTENTVNMSYINSDEYKNKFNNITDNENVNNSIYRYSKAALTHRNGSYYEDIYIIDGKTGSLIAKETTPIAENNVKYSAKTESIIKSHPNKLISIHNHGTNNPPTGSDLGSAGYRRYKMGVVACHNGDVYTYRVGSIPFSAGTFDKAVDKYKSKGYNEIEAITEVLKLFEEYYGIRWNKL